MRVSFSPKLVHRDDWTVGRRKGEKDGVRAEELKRKGMRDGRKWERKERGRDVMKKRERDKGYKKKEERRRLIEDVKRERGRD